MQEDSKGDLTMSSKIVCPKCKIQIGAEHFNEGALEACPFCGAEISCVAAEAPSQLLDAETVGTDGDTLSIGEDGLCMGTALKAGDTIGGFVLERKIGRGGMGEVWLAEQTSMKRKVAIKIMYSKYTDNPSFLYRFNKEVKIIANLDHPNIVTAHDAGEEGGVCYLAMKYVDGDSLSTRLKNQGQIAEKEALTIIKEVAGALQYAWDELKLLHRDIKPGNIMLDPNGKPLVMDMGISRSAIDDSSLTITGVSIGTPYYMSPEQADGLSDIDFRADIYSLGITLYHMVTGVVPYDGTTTASVIKKHVTEPFPLPQVKNPELSDACATLLETMMAKQRENRYQSWAGLIKDIELVLTGMNPEIKPTEPRLANDGGVTFNINGARTNYYQQEVVEDKSNNPKLFFLKAVALIMIVIIFLLWLYPFDGSSSQIDISEVSAGYQPHSDISSVDRSGVTPRPERSSFFQKKKLTLAVLPFANQTADKNFKGPAESCSEAMILPLSRISRINLVERMQLNKVIGEIDLSQTSYVDPEYAIKIGRMLGVDASIMGALQKIGDNIRIVVRVVSSETGKIIYSEHIDGDFDDFFDVQDKLAVSLAEKFE